MKHLHMGAGGLGLGLVVALTAKLRGTDAFVLQRDGHKLDALRDKRFYFRDVKPGGESQQVDISGALSLEQAEEIRVLITQPGPVLLTTALTENGLEGQVERIRDLLSERVSAGHPEPLYVIACENIVGRFYQKLEQGHFGENIHFLPCVVDRLCNNSSVEHGSVRVETEEYGSWVIERRTPWTEELERILAPAIANISFVDDLESEARKKRWLVNGPHFALGLMAHRRRRALLHEFASDPEGGQPFFRGVLAECADAYAYWYQLDPSELADFVDVVYRRFSSFYTETHRVVKRLHPDRLEPLLHAAYERILEPSESFRRARRECPEYLHWALRTLLWLIYVGDYVDPSLDPAPAADRPVSDQAL
ncbi:hypothetical protein GCM10027074_59050 [Streptomyces deserti]